MKTQKSSDLNMTISTSVETSEGHLEVSSSVAMGDEGSSLSDEASSEKSLEGTNRRDPAAAKFLILSANRFIDELFKKNLILTLNISHSN